MLTCAIDGKEFETEKAFHSHISRKLKVKLVDYYADFEERRDLETGELIVFKDREQYLSSLFNNRRNMISYLKKNPSNAKEVIRKLIKTRAEQKELKFAPSTIEGRTSLLPTPVLVEKLGFDYNQVCQEVGLQPKYKYDQALQFIDDEKIKVIVDSREQKPLKLHQCEIATRKLEFGDYTCTSNYKKVFIERKSITDLASTISAGFDRFKRELVRAEDMDCYVLVLIEASLDTLLRMNYIPYLRSIRARPEFITHRIRELMTEFKTQFLFVDGRKEASEVLGKVFRMNNNISELDLQYYYDSKKLI